ncbi:hypothetical protein INS49_014093 [Diaporthe citri]|uniref:uncharacterized protein n=1 Tax=Diaporthe citri TaxID=83186 RepID=UPI001C7F44BD|nr:uncharacterized protein INS49_014093 [Diaporthe citri]KAG6358209.1 hypothetical protein INS49_014093 [Diaporthe citri]
MSPPHGQGGGGRASKPPTPVAPANTLNLSTASPMKKMHTTARSDAVTAVDIRSHRPFITRRLTGQPPAGRPPRPNLPPIDGGSPAPSALGKRGADPVSSPPAPAAKRPANPGTRSDLASADAAMARRGTSVDATNKVLISSSTGREDFMPQGGISTRTSDTSKHPTSATSEQTPADGMSPFTSKDYEGVVPKNTSVTDAMSLRPHIESDLECRACGSRRHGTKDCHVPSSDGTVIICPFHDCTVLDKTGPPGHPLDGHARFHAGDRTRAPLYCQEVMAFEMTARAKNRVSVRRVMPLMFEELVVKRRRKPCCRVVNTEVCAINLAIEYSRVFCQGEMPPELQGMWPYTMRDATDPAIVAKLEQFDELGREGMPPGELEAKSWEQIKQEYTEGIIAPQIHVVKLKQRPTDPVNTAKPTAAQQGGADHARRPPDTEPQAVDASGARLGVRGEEDTTQSQGVTKIDALLEEVQRLSAKVDSVIKRLDIMEARQTGGQPAIEAASSASAPHPDDTDVKMYGMSLHW